MFEILPRDWNLKPIFTQKWASGGMNVMNGGGANPPTIPTLRYLNVTDGQTGGHTDNLS